MKNEQAAAKALPAWLDGGSVAVIGTVLTAAIGLGAMEMGTRAHIDTRVGDVNANVNARIGGVHTRIDDVHTRIGDVHTRIGDVNTRIDRLDRSLNARIHGLSVRIDGLDQRLIGVQEGVAEIRGHLGVPSAVRWQGRKAGTATPPDATPEPLP